MYSNMSTREMAGSYKPPFTDIEGAYGIYITCITCDCVNPSSFGAIADGVLRQASSMGIAVRFNDNLLSEHNNKVSNEAIELWRKVKGTCHESEYLPFLSLMTEPE